MLSPDKEFGAQTIHAIGRCASMIPDVTEACLNGLVALMSKKDETIVAESVVVIKKLLQINVSRKDFQRELLIQCALLFISPRNTVISSNILFVWSIK